ncbi:transcriptional regulator [candidate division KSB1 bacterium]|nr:MAG: transcriptional regulator [candidate division KSB1 bacterium]
MPSPRYTREIPQRYRLEAGKCKNCGFIAFPPRLVCPECHNKEFETIKLSEEGKILTYTIIYVPPANFKLESPYAIGIVEMDGGAKLTAQIVDCSFDEISIGQKVKMVFRKIQSEGDSGIICYGYKCVIGNDGHRNNKR